MDGCCYNPHVSVTDWTGGYSLVEALKHKLCWKCNTEGSGFKNGAINSAGLCVEVYKPLVA